MERLLEGAPPTRGWYSRGYLPHFDGGEIPQMITFCLFDAIPAELMARLRSEVSLLPEDRRVVALQRKAERALNAGRGECSLGRPEVARMMQGSLLHFDGERYRLHAWCVMPNHVHTLFTPIEPHGIPSTLHSWKSFSASEANRMLGRTGMFWMREYFDRYIRDAEHFGYAVAYIERNPVKAGLCAWPEDWPFASAQLRQT